MQCYHDQLRPFVGAIFWIPPTERQFVGTALCRPNRHIFLGRWQINNGRRYFLEARNDRFEGFFSILRSSRNECRYRRLTRQEFGIVCLCPIIETIPPNERVGRNYAALEQGADFSFFHWAKSAVAFGVKPD